MSFQSIKDLVSPTGSSCTRVCFCRMHNKYKVYSIWHQKRDISQFCPSWCLKKLWDLSSQTCWSELGKQILKWKFLKSYPTNVSFFNLENTLNCVCMRWKLKMVQNNSENGEKQICYGLEWHFFEESELMSLMQNETPNYNFSPLSHKKRYTFIY